MNICHKRCKITADLRELTGNTTHESADNAADKPTDSRTDLLKQLAALTDQPGKAGDLCKGTDRSKNDRQLSDKSTHAEHTYHSAGDQCGYRTQCDHNAGQQTDAGDGFHQYACIKSCQSINDAGEECRDHIDCRLNEFGQLLCNTVQQVDQEQHNRVNDFRSIVCKRGEYAGQQCQCTVSDCRDALNKYIHQRKNDGLNSFSDSGSSLSDYAAERYDSLTELFGNGRDQRGNPCDDRAESCHNNGHTCAERSSQSGNADCNSRQSGTGSEKTCSDSCGTDTDQRKCSGKRQDRRNKRGQHKTGHTDYGECTGNRHKPLGNALPTH